MKSKFMPPAHAARFGWCYGRLEALDTEHTLATPGRYANASQMPMIGFGSLNNQMMVRAMVPMEAQREISEVLAGIPAENLPTNAEGDSAFALGYYKGLAGAPLALAPPPFDIAAERERKGWTQQQLAEAAGVPQEAISLWESGKRKPRASSLEKIKKALE